MTPRTVRVELNINPATWDASLDAENVRISAIHDGPMPPCDPVPPFDGLPDGVAPVDTEIFNANG